MTLQKQLSVGFIISLVIATATMPALNGVALFSGMGLAYALGGALLLLLGPILTCTVPAGIHWLIWRERLNGNELSIIAIWFFACLSLVLAFLSEVVMK